MTQDGRQHEQAASDWLGTGVRLGLCLVLFSFCWMVGFAVANQHRIAELWLAASEQRYLSMTGDVGAVTYLVQHSDYLRLEQAALAQDDVLGIEIYRYPAVAAIAFIGPDSPAIARIAALDMVEGMEQRVVPMICH